MERPMKANALFSCPCRKCTLIKNEEQKEKQYGVEITKVYTKPSQLVKDSRWHTQS
jgi:hypothetical protein